MPLPTEQSRQILLEGLTPEQQNAVMAPERRLLVIAGAGSGKTEVMARRVAWWVAVEGVPKDDIIAFTFTEAAAEELKFRIRGWMQRVAAPGEDPTLAGMYIGTIHGFCLKVLREFAADSYYVFDVLDEAGRVSLIEQGHWNILALNTFTAAAQAAGRANGKFDAVDLFLKGYDLLNEYGVLDVQLSANPVPADLAHEREWCAEARLLTDVGNSALALAFSDSAARYYAYLRARRFMDFSTVQSELVAKLNGDAPFLERVRARWSRIVVDEVQDINPVQYALLRALVGDQGHLTAVGDHRQAIYQFRGGRVDLMGDLFNELHVAPDGRIIELAANFRSTPRIIALANQWSNTIRDRAGMSNPAMAHGRATRVDYSPNHVGLLKFDTRDDEAEWIAASVDQFVRDDQEPSVGLRHDERDQERGITLSDIAILVRSSTDIRTYQEALRRRGIPSVVRGGADLFSQPEVLLFLGAFAICGGMDAFFGDPSRDNSLPGRIRNALNAAAQPEAVVQAAFVNLRNRGMAIEPIIADRVIRLAEAIHFRTMNDGPLVIDLGDIHCDEARRWCRTARRPSRVFPQQIFHWLIDEARLGAWGTDANAQQMESIYFHVGQLSTLVKGLETSGWTPPGSLKYQIIALTTWGTGSARIPEAPLLVSPNAVSITTIHSAKGLEFPVVFLADANAGRFPSSKSRHQVKVPFDAEFYATIDPEHLRDNADHDNERRLMYVALTRAERYLFVSYSGNRTSSFISGSLRMLFPQVGGVQQNGGLNFNGFIEYRPSTYSRESRLTTSFSDLRYYLECPHDFYLRKVLGFTPTISQEFGYGRGVHNLLRAVHSDPARWAQLAPDSAVLEAEIRRLIDSGLFYMRYTTGDPLANLQNHAVRGVKEYVERYAAELATVQFEPEREFETLFPEDNLLIAGAIDVVRLDDPPRVTIIDFKSGNADAENGSGLSHEMMRLQIGVYGLAARDELEYDPQHGLVRYIGERDAAKRESSVELSDAELTAVRDRVRATGRSIQERLFQAGPTGLVQNRCAGCDFKMVCGRHEARAQRP